MAFLPLLQFTPDTFVNTLVPEWVHWSAAPVYALLISVFIVALSYMVAEFLRSPQLNAWAKNELYEFIVSALIVGSLFFGLALMNGIVFELTGGLDHFEVAQDYLNTLIYVPTAVEFSNGNGLIPGHLINSYFWVWFFETLSGVLGSMQFNFILTTGPRLAYVRIGTVPLIGLEQLSAPLLSVLDIMGMVILFTIAQKALLTLFQETMLTLFLPLGIVLRTFPLSRKLGSTLIAIAITCYVVYPLTLVMNIGIYDSVPKDSIVTEALDYNGLLAKVGEGKAGDPCTSSAQCEGTDCTNGKCEGAIGMDCTDRVQCFGAPCLNEFNHGLDCSDPSNDCTCHSCPAVGAPCTFNTECCGNCVGPDGAKTCQILNVNQLFGSTYYFKAYDNPACAPPGDPVDCIADGDCPCSGKCLEYPDGTLHCAVPSLGEEDMVDLLQTSDGNSIECLAFFSTCWWTDNYGKSVAVVDKIKNGMAMLFEYALYPFAFPLLMFDLLRYLLPKLLWPAVVAGALAIVDIIICVTFFRSISESIGGEPTIWGLSKAL